MNYVVQIMYNSPSWEEVQVEAETEEEAKELALTEFERQFPEALDTEIESIYAS